MPFASFHAVLLPDKLDAAVQQPFSTGLVYQQLIAIILHGCCNGDVGRFLAGFHALGFNLREFSFPLDQSARKKLP